MTTPPGSPNYTLYQAQADIAALRGQIQHLLANAPLVNVIFTGTITGPDGTVWGSTGIVRDTWHNLSLNGGFGTAGGFGTPRYQKEPDNGGRVRLSGVIALTANQAANTTIATLPSGYRPTVKRDLPPNTNLSGTNTFALLVDTGGNLIMQNAGTNGNFIGLDGITFELD